MLLFLSIRTTPFAIQLDQKDKILADFVSVDVYDADGECYYRPDDPEGDDYELVPGYWNAHEEEEKGRLRMAGTESF